MKHIKTLNTQTLNNTMKKADVENARHLASQHARHHAQLETRLANRRDSGNHIIIKTSSDSVAAFSTLGKEICFDSSV